MSDNEGLYHDSFRKKWIKKRPEEIIRTALLQKMVDELGYPRSYIVVEKGLHTLPHLSLHERENIPPRRLDIVVFSKDLHEKHPLFPLLLIECKADSLTPECANQLIGYNDIVKAPFIALANGKTALTGRYNPTQKQFHFIEGFYSYKELLELVVA